MDVSNIRLSDDCLRANANRLFEKIWVEFESKDLNISPNKIPKQSSVILNKLQRRYSERATLSLINSEIPAFDKTAVSFVMRHLTNMQKKLNCLGCWHPAAAWRGF